MTNGTAWSAVMLPSGNAQPLLCFLVPSAGTSVRTGNPFPFAHVRRGLRLRLRDGYAKVLRDRVASTAPPVRLSPPPIDDVPGSVRVEGGCLMCGVATVTVPTARVARLGDNHAAAGDVWRATSITVGADRLSGHLCPACAAAMDAVGAIGPTAVERALLAHLDASCPDELAERLRSRLIDGDPPPLPTTGSSCTTRWPAGCRSRPRPRRPGVTCRRVVELIEHVEPSLCDCRRQLHTELLLTDQFCEPLPVD